MWFEIGAEEETVRGAMIGLIQLSRKSIVAHYEHIWGICEVGKTHITMSIDLYVDTYIYVVMECCMFLGNCLAKTIGSNSLGNLLVTRINKDIQRLRTIISGSRSLRTMYTVRIC